jgi:glycosyltransferase involved in cell wall biosynthesis
MYDHPLVSIIITTYNRRNLLPKAIESVANQTYDQCELIVVNDAGDDVEDIIKTFERERYKYSGIMHRPIKYINKEKNAGLGAARNTGLEYATGKYVNFLDDDDIFYPFHVQTLVGFMEKNNHKIAYTDAVCHVIKDNQVIGRTIGYSFDYDADMLLYQNITPVLTVMYELNEVTKDIKFDENARVYEDWLQWLELTKHYPMNHLAIPTCMYTFRQDGSTMSSSRNEFTTMLPDIYGKTWHRAKKQVAVAMAMNEILQRRGLPLMFQIGSE